MLIQNHSAIAESLVVMNSIEKDDFLKSQAFKNVKNNPLKFIKNWFSGLSIMTLAMPFSYKYQKLEHLLIVLPNMFIIVFSCVCIYPTWRLYKNNSLEYSILFLLLIVIVYFLLSCITSSYWRQFNLIVPVLLYWISIVIDRTFKVKF